MFDPLNESHRPGHSHAGKTLGKTLAVGALLASASPALANTIAPTESAATILYTFSGNGTGTLNGQSFVNAAFTITAQADTSQIISPVAGVFSVTDVTASISIAGLGVATFTDQMITVLNQNNNNSTLPAIGFSDVTKGVAVIFESNPTFGTYDLDDPDSVVLAKSDQLSPNNTFATSLGNLSLTSVTAGSYSANISAPDATSTLGLLSLSVATLCLVRRKYSFSKAV